MHFSGGQRVAAIVFLLVAWRTTAANSFCPHSFLSAVAPLKLRSVNSPSTIGRTERRTFFSGCTKRKRTNGAPDARNEAGHSDFSGACRRSKSVADRRRIRGGLGE